MNLVMTEHFAERMKERGLNADEIMEALTQGKPGKEKLTQQGLARAYRFKMVTVVAAKQGGKTVLVTCAKKDRPSKTPKGTRFKQVQRVRAKAASAKRKQRLRELGEEE